MDRARGLVSVEVIKQYRQANENIAQVPYSKTCIVDRKYTLKSEYYDLKFHTQYYAADDPGNILFQETTVRNEALLPVTKQKPYL